MDELNGAVEADRKTHGKALKPREDGREERNQGEQNRPG